VANWYGAADATFEPDPDGRFALVLLVLLPLYHVAIILYTHIVDMNEVDVASDTWRKASLLGLDL
jgi:hypothetical protein